MSSEFPKLQKKLPTIKWEITKMVEKLIEDKEIEDLEIDLDSIRFISRSSASKSAFYLRNLLDTCWDDKSEEFSDSSKLSEEHVLAAQALIKLRKYQKTAICFLTKVLTLTLDEENKKHLESGTESQKKKAREEDSRIKSLRKLGSEAILACGSDISSIDRLASGEKNSFDGNIICANGQCCYRENGQNIDCWPS